MVRASFAFRLTLLAALTAAVLLGSLVLGAAGLPLREVVAALAGNGEETTRAIVVQLRLPRALMALLIGGGLGVTGAVFQALLRNPLAEPYILGISGGAALGAVAAIVTGWAAAAAWGLPLAAFMGAVLAVALVFRIAHNAGGGLDTRVLLLAGVMAGAFFNAVVLLLLTWRDAETFRTAIFWIFGDLSRASWGSVGLTAAYLAPALALLVALARPLNSMTVGEEAAFYLGTRVERVKLGAYIVASFTVAAGVAAVGAIGFIGLVVPHAIRLLWGPDHRFLLPASALAGGAFLLLADTTARTIAAPSELPVGIITALAGVPIFVLLLARGGRS